MNIQLKTNRKRQVKTTRPNTITVIRTIRRKRKTTDKATEEETENETDT